MKVIIAGSRNFSDYSALKKKIDEFQQKHQITEIVSGGAEGADRLGEIYAEENGIPVEIFPADWSKNGKAAGPIRNRQMANYADALLAVWDGSSKGTKNMIEEMHKLKKPVFVAMFNFSLTTGYTE